MYVLIQAMTHIWHCKLCHC